MKVHDLLDAGKPGTEQRRTKCASIADDVQGMLSMAAELADQIGAERARDFFRGAATMAAHGNAELVAPAQEREAA